MPFVTNCCADDFTSIDKLIDCGPVIRGSIAGLRLEHPYPDNYIVVMEYSNGAEYSKKVTKQWYDAIYSALIKGKKEIIIPI